MRSWLPKLLGAKRREPHPPWQKGQYVTYFLERSDGSWVAIAMHLVEQLDDNAWVIQANFKTPDAEHLVFLRCDPDAPRGEPGAYIAPIGAETVRGSPSGVFDTPLANATLAMNLLGPRQHFPEDKELHGPRAVQYPCGISEVRTSVSAGPGYTKHHDLHPRVMVTGVARLTAR